MHSAESLRQRYLQEQSTPGEINAIARIYAEVRSMPFEQALEEVHEGVGYELSGGGSKDEASGGAPEAFPWDDVSRSLVPLGRQWINGV
ncbi:MAG: hypothetical protein ACO3FN_09430 [Vulcanococcus sp.]